MILKTFKKTRRGALASLAYATRYVAPGGRRVPKNPPQNILIVSTTGYGDTLWSIPAITKVRQQYPEAYIAALTSTVSYEILRYHPAIDEFFRYGVRFDALVRWPRLIRQLCARCFDRTYFLHFSDSSVVSLCLFAQARAFYGAGGTLRGLDSYFDYVAPEMSRPQRMDERSCVNCHAVEGRVPSMELAGPDGNGYWTVAKMLKNYLILQQRVNVADIETSKLLRKPLNVQTGKEDGHQGGRRYLPAERGYQIIRHWVLDQPRVMQSLGTTSATR